MNGNKVGKPSLELLELDLGKYWYVVAWEVLVGKAFEMFEVRMIDVAQHLGEVVLVVAVCKPDVVNDALELRGVRCLCEKTLRV